MRFYTSHCVLLKPRIKRDVKSHLRFVERGVCIVVGEVLYLAWCLGMYKVVAIKPIYKLKAALFTQASFASTGVR
ncbi:hypothetical protein EU508_17515 [Pseudoalteromonas fuliginea]|uniref:Uncharacterized protein n=1 Tax=Pseudoalteromonas fuliginea TaxID=1872678 RepID=A0AB73BDA0_9GAMM|nr:hypothetical protein EU508_17515 [Pseudoalteromonas fuliginea]